MASGTKKPELANWLVTLNPEMANNLGAWASGGAPAGIDSAAPPGPAGSNVSQPQAPVLFAGPMSAAPAAPGGGSGGKGGGQSPPPPAPQNTPWRETYDNATNYFHTVEKYNERVAAVKHERETLENSWAEQQQLHRRGKINSQVYLLKQGEYEHRQAEITAKLDSLNRDGHRLQVDGRAVASDIARARRAGTADPVNPKGLTSPAELVSKARKDLDSSLREVEAEIGRTRGWPRGGGPGGRNSPTDAPGGTQANKKPQVPGQPPSTKGGGDPKSGANGQAGSGASGGGGADPRGGTGGPDKPPADPIEQLEKWKKEGKISGDVEGLKRRLKSDDAQTVKKAQEDFRHAQATIAKGKTFQVKARGEGTKGPSKGQSRESQVAERVQGKVAKVGRPGHQVDKSYTHNNETIKVDVEGPNGELIVVGGPGEANKMAQLGSDLARLKRVADGKGLKAQAYFEEGTPPEAIKLAEEKLGKGNVHTFKGDSHGGGAHRGEAPPDTKGGAQAYKTPQDPAKPTKGTGGGDPKAPAGTPPKASPSPATPSQPFDLSKFQQSVAEVLRQAEAQKKAFDDLQRRLEKSRSPAETKQLREKRSKLGGEIKGKTAVEIEKLAKQLASAPEMAGVAGGSTTETISKARERFSKVASGGKAIGNALSQLQTAFVLVDSVAEILSARSATEAITKTLKAEAGIAAGAGEYALFKYALGSAPPAVLLGVVVGMKNDQGASVGYRYRLSAKKQLVDSWLREKVPGYDPDHKDGDRELRDQVVREFDQMRREHVLQQAKDRGLDDGLSRNTTDEHELWPTDEDQMDLGITPDDFLLAYREGLAEGKSQRPGAILRAHEPGIKLAHDAGFKDGKDGKPANFEALKKGPALRALQHKAEDLQERGELDNDELKIIESVYHAYERGYDKGYQEGQKAGKAMVVKELQVSPNGFTIGAYTKRLLTATLVFSDKSTKDVTGEVHWKSSDENIVNISVTPNGTTYAAIGRNGGAQVTASYAGFFGSHAKTVTITVNPPRIAVRPEKITLRVGQEQRFGAGSLVEASDPGQIPTHNLDSSVIAWGSDDPTKISIDADGNAKVLALSDHPVTIMASDKFGMAQGRAIVTIR
jgi:hypothetical protein